LNTKEKAIIADGLSSSAPPKIILSNQFYQDLKLLSDLFILINKSFNEKNIKHKDPQLND
jgi:hypothetical protein